MRMSPGQVSGLRNALSEMVRNLDADRALLVRRQTRTAALGAQRLIDALASGNGLGQRLHDPETGTPYLIYDWPTGGYDEAPWSPD